MESNTIFMHSQLALFFLPRLPSDNNDLDGDDFWLRFFDAPKEASFLAFFFMLE